MLSLVEFKSDFIAGCEKAICSRGLQDIRIEERDVTKPQRGKLNGLLFKQQGSNCAPTLYVEDFYKYYQEGRSVEQLSYDALDAVRNGFEVLKQARSVDFEAPVQTRLLRVRLLNKSMNRAFLEKVPYRDLGGGFVFVAEMRSGEYSAVITRGLMEDTGLSEEELFDDALMTSLEDDPPVLFPLTDALDNDGRPGINLLEESFRGSFGESLEEGRSGPLLSGLQPLVLTTAGTFRGAAALFYPGVIEGIHDLLEDDFYVLPSSVHEVIIVGAYGSDPEALTEMLRSANRTVVEEGDVLANDIYICRAGSISRVSYGGVIPEGSALPC